MPVHSLVPVSTVHHDSVLARPDAMNGTASTIVRDSIDHKDTYDVNNNMKNNGLLTQEASNPTCTKSFDRVARAPHK